MAGTLRQRGGDRHAYAFLVAFVASVGGFLFGYDLAIVCGANLYLKEVFHLSSAEFGFATGSAALGCILGPFLGAWMCDALGRNRTMIVACALLGIGSLFTAIPNDIVTFNVFRIVGGVGVGLCSVASPLYISETSPPAVARRARDHVSAGHCRRQRGRAVRLLSDRELGSGRHGLAVDVRVGTAARGACSWCCCSFCRKARAGWRDAAGRTRRCAVLARVDGPEFARSEMEQIQAALQEESGALRGPVRAGRPLRPAHRPVAGILQQLDRLERDERVHPHAV